MAANAHNFGMAEPLVHIEASAPDLARALRFHLQSLGLRVTNGSAHAANVVITLVTECSTDRCRELAAEGVRVIVLAPVPRDADRERYTAAGAFYLPMTLDRTLLVSAIRGTEPGARPPPSA